MEQKEYIEKLVKILDALAKDEIGDDENPKYIQTLHLLLQDVETNVIFQAQLQETDVRKIIKFNSPLTSKQMIDLATALRQREAPLKLLVPKDSTELSVDDVIKSRTLDFQQTKQRTKSKRKKYNNNRNIITNKK